MRLFLVYLILLELWVYSVDVVRSELLTEGSFEKDVEHNGGLLGSTTPPALKTSSAPLHCTWNSLALLDYIFTRSDVGNLNNEILGANSLAAGKADETTSDLTEVLHESKTNVASSILGVTHPTEVQASAQLSSDTEDLLSSSDALRESDLTIDLPPLEDASTGGIDEHQIPTFNEFHAMVSEGNGNTNGVGRSTVFGLDDSQHIAVPSRLTNARAALREPPMVSSGSHSASAASTNESEPNIQAMTDDEHFNYSETKANVSNSEVDSSGSRESKSIPKDPNDDVFVAQGSSKSTRVNVENVNNEAVPGDLLSSDVSHSSEVPVTLRRNVAAVGCFAKLLEASKAIKNPEAILNENSDEYMNVPCSADKWFIIEACEPVQLRDIELANYELFSSRVKTFRVSISDRYPAKSWDVIGVFTARDVKGRQTFNVSSDKLIKYIRFEMLEHYGSEHYCPLSMIRLFGRVSDDLDEEDDDLALRTADELSTSVPSALPSDVFSDVSISSGSLEPTDPIETSENMLPNITEDVEAESAQLHFVPPNAVSTLETQNCSDESLSEVSEPSEGSLSQTDFTNTNTNRHTNSVLLNRASQLKNKPTGTPSAIVFRDALPEASVEMSCNAEFSADLGVQCPHSKVPGSLQPDARGWRSEQHTSTVVQPANSQKSALSSTATLSSPDAHQVLKHKVEGFVPKKPTFGIFQRLKEVFLSALGFIFHSVVSPATDFGRQEYNLSTVPLCSQHLLAIRSLFVYGLLNHSKTSELPIQLPESKKRGLDILLCCLQHLEGLVEEEYSRTSTDSVSIKHRILRISQKDGRPAVTSCEESIKLLNLSFAAVHKYDQSYWRSDYNILQLFVAHRYFLLFGRTSVEEFFVRIWCELQGSPDTGLKAMMSCAQPMCPKLPSFLLKLASETELVKPVISYEPTLRSEAPSYSTLNKHNSGYSKIESAKTRAEIVVPAALVGSRKDTTLMRLSNRVRLLERNVSVSMRYLEELSQSYRRQMDRLSRSFNLTTSWLKATAQGAEERDHMQQARIDELEIRLDELLTRLIPEALRSASNDSIYSENNVSHSTSKQNLTIPPVMSVPSLLNFDAPPDWAHSTATWPPLEDDWTEEDGTVETEDEHSVEPRTYRDQKIRAEERSRDAMISGTVFEHRDCTSAEYLSEPDTLKQMFENWFSFPFPSNPFRFSGKWTLQLPREDSHVFWIFSMTVIHLVFAVTSHLIVYLAWLRPYSQKLRNSSGSLASVGKHGIRCLDSSHPLRHIPDCSSSFHHQPKAPIGVLTDLMSCNSANHNSFTNCSKDQSISPHGEYIAQFATTKEQSPTVDLTESTDNKSQPPLLDRQMCGHIDQPADAGCQPSNAVTVCDSSSHPSSFAGLTSIPTCPPCVSSSHAKFERRVALLDPPRMALKTDSSNSWTSYPKHLADGFCEKTTLESKAYSHSSVLSKNARRRRNRRERVKLHKIRKSSEDVSPNSSSISSVQG